MHADILTAEEHASSGLHAEFRKRISAIPHAKVLDWGCGRGSDVLHLRNSGVEAYGAEIDPETIERGKPLFAQLGVDHSTMIRPISPQNTTSFPAGFFDIIISYQVLEHVEDLPSALKEMQRLLRPGGLSVHLFPAHLRPFEGHLMMPLVHWLPKNRLRLLAIYSCVLMGMEPRGGWIFEGGNSAWNRARRYYDFSVRETFYRPPRKLKREFVRAGLVPSFEGRLHERIVGTAIEKVPARLLEWLLSTFAGVVLVAKKPGPVSCS